MAEGRRTLGRGLSALLGEASEGAAEPGAIAAGAREAPIELLRRNPDQPRRTFDETELDELAASIREKGVLQPILVRPAPGAAGEFQIVAGERRWRAAQRAGLRSVPVLVREFDDLEVLEIAIVENVQRADLGALEEAMGYRALIDRFGRTQDAVAQTVGKSRSHVANALRLLQLPPEIQAHITEGRITAGHARALITAHDPQQLVGQVIRQGLSVRDTETLARGRAPEIKSVEGLRRPRAADPDTAALESDLSETLGLGVEIRDRHGSGEVRIRYASLEQLDDLCRRLSRSATGVGTASGLDARSSAEPSSSEGQDDPEWGADDFLVNLT